MLNDSRRPIPRRDHSPTGSFVVGEIISLNNSFNNVPEITTYIEFECGCWTANYFDNTYPVNSLHCDYRK